MMLEDLLEEYLLELSVKGYSKDTIKTNRDSVNTFIKFTGDGVIVNQVNLILFKRFIADQQTRCKASTINARAKVIRSMFSWAVQEELLDKNPLERFKLLKVEKPMIKAYSKSDAQKLLYSLKGNDYFTVRNRTIITMLVETGIRNTELCSIKLKDVHDDSIRIEGKGNKIRFVPISNPLQLQLRRYKRVRDSFMSGESSEYLFVSNRRDKLMRKSLLAIITKICDAVGINVATTVHNFRRMFAQQMLRQVDLYTLSRLLGHSQLQTTERYIVSIEDAVIMERGRLHSPLTQKN